MATTRPMGAVKWQNAFSETLRGAEVVILPGNDQPGRRGGVLMKGTLTTRARILEIRRASSLCSTRTSRPGRAQRAPGERQPSPGGVFPKVPATAPSGSAAVI